MENQQSDDRLAKDLDLAELKKRKLEIEDLESKNSRLERFIRYSSVLTTIIAVIGLILGQYQSYLQQKDRERAVALERERDNTLREQEFRKPFWQRRIDLYFDASDAVAKLANLKDGSEREKARERYEQLFYGPLVIVEDDKVAAAMVDIRTYLEQCDVDPKSYNRATLNGLSLALADSCRESIGESWQTKLESLKGKYRKEP